MFRKPFQIGALLLALALLPVLAFAEEPLPATPTDLACSHAHTQTVIYFFDSPSYTSVGAASHRVYGPGTVVTACRDCGEVLSAETVDNAEELRPHSIKKGVCALCGYRQKTQAAQTYRDNPGERTLIAQEDTDGLFVLTLTRQDLAALSNARVETALVRAEKGTAVVALDVEEIRAEVSREEASLSLEMAEREDGSFFAALHLVSGSREPVEPEGEGVTLRFYPGKKAKLRFALAPADRDALTELESVWHEDGYWSVPYITEGTYFLLQK